jgi:hypothetical protein
MEHRCTWRQCGAPATKCIRIRLRNPFVKHMREDGTIYEVEAEGRDLWRCEKHYQEQSAHWDEMEATGVFIVER